MTGRLVHLCLFAGLVFLKVLRRTLDSLCSLRYNKRCHCISSSSSSASQSPASSYVSSSSANAGGWMIEFVVDTAIHIVDNRKARILPWSKPKADARNRIRLQLDRNSLNCSRNCCRFSAPHCWRQVCSCTARSFARNACVACSCSTHHIYSVDAASTRL
jgi:hypothetical protein